MRYLLSCLLVLCSSMAQAETTSTFTLQAEIDGQKLKGVPCEVTVAGVTTQVTTPAKLSLVVDSKGVPESVSISCQYNGLTRKITEIPDERSIKISPNFGAVLGPVIFYKSNGGVSAYLKEDGTIVRVD